MSKLRTQWNDQIGGIAEFLRLGLGYNSLANYYVLNFQLIQHHKYSLHEVESLIPFERDIYVSMLRKWIEEENERQKQRAQS